MLHGRRILIADDARVMRMLVRTWLERLGARVEEVSNGAEALHRAQAGGIDLLFLDINMPHLSGLSVLTHVRKDPRTERLPVIMLTTLGRPEDIDRGQRLGATAYLTKPLSYGALVRALHAIFAPKPEAPRERQEAEAS